MEDYRRWQTLKDSAEHQRKKLADKNKNLEFYLKNKRLSSDESSLLFAEVENNETKIKELERTILECHENLKFWTEKDYSYSSTNPLARGWSWTPSPTEQEWRHMPNRNQNVDELTNYSSRRSRQTLAQGTDIDDDIRVKEETLKALGLKIEKCSSDIIRKRKEIDEMLTESKIISDELKRKKDELKSVKEDVDRYRTAVLREKNRVAKLESKKDELNSQIESLTKSLRENNEAQRRGFDVINEKGFKDELNITTTQMSIQGNRKTKTLEKKIFEYEKLFAEKDDQIASLMAEMEGLRSQSIRSGREKSYLIDEELMKTPRDDDILESSLTYQEARETKPEFSSYDEELKNLQEKLNNLETDIIPDLQKRNSDLIFHMEQLEKENDCLLSVNQDMATKLENLQQLNASQKWSEKVLKKKKSDSQVKKQSRDKISVEDFLGSDKEKGQTKADVGKEDEGYSPFRAENGDQRNRDRTRESTKLEEDKKESMSKSKDDAMSGHRESIRNRPATQLRRETVLEGKSGFDFDVPDGRHTNGQTVQYDPLNLTRRRSLNESTIQDDLNTAGQTEHLVTVEPGMRTGQHGGMFQNHDTEYFGMNPDEIGGEYDSQSDHHDKRSNKLSKTEIQYKKTLQVKERFKSKSRKLNDSSDSRKKFFKVIKEREYSPQPEDSALHERDVDQFFEQRNQDGVIRHKKRSSHKSSGPRSRESDTEKVIDEGSSPLLLSQNVEDEKEEQHINIEITEGLGPETLVEDQEDIKNSTTLPGENDSEVFKTCDNDKEKRVRFHDNISNITGGKDLADDNPEQRSDTINVSQMDENELSAAVQELTTENVKLKDELEKARSMITDYEQKLRQVQPEQPAEPMTTIPEVDSTNIDIGLKSDSSSTNINFKKFKEQTQDTENEEEVHIKNEPLHSGPNIGRVSTADTLVESEVKSEYLQSAFGPQSTSSNTGDTELTIRDLQRELEARDRRHQELEERLRDVKRERDTFKNKYLRYEKKDERKLEDKYDDISDLHKKVSSVERKAHRKEADIYKDNLKLERDLDLAKTKLSEAEKEVKRLKKEAEQSETEKEKELKRLSDTVPNLEKERDELKQQLEQLQRFGVEVPEYSSKMRSVPDKAQTDPDTGAVDKDRKDSVAEEKKASVGLLGKLRGLSRKGEKKETIKDESKEDTDVLAENKKLKEELAQLNETVPRLEKERDTLKKELERVQQKEARPEKDGVVQGSKDKDTPDPESDVAQSTFDRKQQKESGDPTVDTNEQQERIKVLERQLAKVKGVDPNVLAENQRLKEELRQTKAEIDKLRKIHESTNDENFRNGTFPQDQLDITGDPMKSKQVKGERRAIIDDTFVDDDREQLQRDLEEALQKIKDYELELQGLREERNQMVNESDKEYSRSRKSKKSPKNDAANVRLEKENNALRKELDDANNRLVVSEEQLQELQHAQKVTETSTNTGKSQNGGEGNQHMNKQYQDSETAGKPTTQTSNGDDLRVENRRLKEELTQSRIEIDGLLQKLRENEEHIETLQKENTHVLAEEDSEMTSSHQNTSDVLEHRDEYKQLKEELTQTQTELETTKQSLHGENKTVQEELLRLKDELEGSNQQIKEYEEQIEILRKKRDRAVAEKDRAIARLRESENNLRLYINKIDSMKKERVKEIASQKEAFLRQQMGTGASEKRVEELEEKLKCVTAELEETEKRLKYSEDAMRCHYTRKK